jgi:hypothetical protein
MITFLPERFFNNWTLGPRNSSPLVLLTFEAFDMIEEINTKGWTECEQQTFQMSRLRNRLTPSLNRNVAENFLGLAC